MRVRSRFITHFFSLSFWMQSAQHLLLRVICLQKSEEHIWELTNFFCSGIIPKRRRSWPTIASAGLRHTLRGWYCISLYISGMSWMQFLSENAGRNIVRMFVRFPDKEKRKKKRSKKKEEQRKWERTWNNCGKPSIEWLDDFQWLDSALELCHMDDWYCLPVYVAWMAVTLFRFARDVWRSSCHTSVIPIFSDSNGNAACSLPRFCRGSTILVDENPYIIVWFDKLLARRMPNEYIRFDRLISDESRQIIINQ